MDHTLSSFPSGLPGSGLLLLRLVLAGYLLAAGASAAALGPGATTLHDIVLGSYGVMAVLGGALVVAGSLTRIVLTSAAVAELVAVAVHLSTPGFEVLVFGSWRAAILAAGIATALGLLGPGAYSVDAVLFGRQEIVIRPVAPHTRSGRAPADFSPAYPNANAKR
jgi:uncharacterized membrane protein YphA (DoxX/SURF4 family)